MRDITKFEDEIAAGAIQATEFRPVATYDPDGDCIEFFASNENFYARRLDSLVTVYYSMETDEVIGSVIKGVRKIFEEAKKRVPDFFVVEVEGERLKLEHVFSLCAWGQGRKPHDMEVRIYQSLRQAAKRGNVELNASQLMAA